MTGKYVNMADINLDSTSKAVALVELMFFAYRDFVADPDHILEGLGFGRAHHRVLHFVGRNPGLTVAGLLDILQITKQSLARVLKDLIDGGYVFQKAGEDDRRQRLLHLTPTGEGLRQKLIAPQIARFQRALTETQLAPEQFGAMMLHLIDPANQALAEDLAYGHGAARG
jgi:DNA-binding MarR family transcriptional regulator